MSHIYSNEFFDYIDRGARRSANRLIRCVQTWIKPRSVVDFGCGRGVWLSEWAAAGCTEIAGVDGDYVDRDRLTIPRESFFGKNLVQPIDLGRRFDVAQSLEVGEHLPDEASASLVKSLTNHADVILFSAAVPGQGGECHINEQPLSYWQDKFAASGYSAYDCLRPQLFSDRSVEPWYRFNTVLYANEAGAQRLPTEVLETKTPYGALTDVGTFGWNMRKMIVRRLSGPTVTAIAQARASYIARSYRGKG